MIYYDFRRSSKIFDKAIFCSKCKIRLSLFPPLLLSTSRPHSPPCQPPPRTRLRSPPRRPCGAHIRYGASPYTPTPTFHRLTLSPNPPPQRPPPPDFIFPPPPAPLPAPLLDEILCHEEWSLQRDPSHRDHFKPRNHLLATCGKPWCASAWVCWRTACFFEASIKRPFLGRAVVFPRSSIARTFLTPHQRRRRIQRRPSTST